MIVKRLLVASLLGTCLLGACAPRPTRPARPEHMGHPIDTLALRAHTYFLAHDLLRGRGTGTPGSEIAALYIVSQCRALGLEPVAGSYRHRVPLERVRVLADSSAVTLEGADGSPLVFRMGVDVVPVAGARNILRDFEGPLIWVGSGREITGSPAELPDVRGAVAVTAGPIRAPAARILQSRGARGAVHLVNDAETFALYRASRGAELMALADTTVTSSFFPPLPAVIGGPRTVEPVLAGTRRAHRVQVRVRTRRTPIRADNIACALPGADRDRRDTAIAFTAHYDHLGVSVPDERGDSIYNGFSDNATGVAMLLAIAEAIRASPNGFRHTALFLFFTGEERGLLGSDYFVAHPPYPLERIRAVINLDAGAPPAKPWNWRIAGGDATPLGALAMDVAAARGWSATLSPATPNSDYFPFARAGVPAVFIIPGSAPYEGLSADSSDALRARWDRYHQAGDEWHADFPFAGVQRYAEYALRLALAVDRRGSVDP